MYATYEYPSSDFKALKPYAKKRMTYPNLTQRQMMYLQQDILNPTQRLTAYGNSIDVIPPFNNSLVSIVSPSDYQFHDSVQQFQRAIANASAEENKYNTSYGNFVNTDSDHTWIVDPRTYKGLLKTLNPDGNSFNPSGSLSLSSIPNPNKVAQGVDGVNVFPTFYSF